MPRLDLPFAESVQRQARTGHGYERSRAWAAQHGVGWTDAAASFAQSGLTPEMLRHDPCCHYNPEGHAALATVIAEAMDTRDPALAD
jgi:cytochrome c1